LPRAFGLDRVRAFAPGGLPIRKAQAARAARKKKKEWKKTIQVRALRVMRFPLPDLVAQLNSHLPNREPTLKAIAFGKTDSPDGIRINVVASLEPAAQKDPTFPVPKNGGRDSAVVWKKYIAIPASRRADISWIQLSTRAAVGTTPNGDSPRPSASPQSDSRGPRPDNGHGRGVLGGLSVNDQVATQKTKR